MPRPYSNTTNGTTLYTTSATTAIRGFRGFNVEDWSRILVSQERVVVDDEPRPIQCFDHVGCDIRLYSHEISSPCAVSRVYSFGTDNDHYAHFCNVHMIEGTEMVKEAMQIVVRD